MISRVLMFFICITHINIACGRVCLTARMLNWECVRICSPSYIDVQMRVVGRCCSFLKGVEVRLRKDSSGRQNHCLMTQGAVLMLCLGPWDSVWLINKLLICTMCLQHLWVSQSMMRKCVSSDGISTGVQAGHMKITLGVTDGDSHHEQSIYCETPWINKDM